MRTKAAVALASCIIMAPPALADGISYGLRAGTGIASFYGDDVTNAGFRAAACAGGFVTYRVNGTFAVQPELLFSMKGNAYDAEGIRTTTRLDYIEIPLCARLDLPERRIYGPYALAGPYVGFTVGKQSRIETAGTERVGTLDGVNPVELGVVAGGGVEIELHTVRLVIDLRYVIGLTDVFESAVGPDGGGDDRVSVKNRAVLFTVGMRL